MYYEDEPNWFCSLFGTWFKKGKTGKIKMPFVKREKCVCMCVCLLCVRVVGVGEKSWGVLGNHELVFR